MKCCNFLGPGFCWEYAKKKEAMYPLGACLIHMLQIFALGFCEPTRNQSKLWALKSDNVLYYTVGHVMGWWVVYLGRWVMFWGRWVVCLLPSLPSMLAQLV